VKFSVLKLRNLSGRARRLSLTGYVEWVLGDLRGQAGHARGQRVRRGHRRLARAQFFNNEFPGRGSPSSMPTATTPAATRGFTCDRIEFLGRNRTLRRPAALQRTRLSGRLGAGLDPCAALQLAFELEDGESRETVFRLGLGRDLADARTLLQRFRGAAAATQALQTVHAHWHSVLGVLQVRTPDPALDVLANGWLLYQTMACRFWARSGFYQSGGAFGFRDQLQDAMALVHADPVRVRAHLLLCAAHQFPEGDVQHWWHRRWTAACARAAPRLPVAAAAVVARYLSVPRPRRCSTRPVPFVEGRPVAMDEEGYYDLPVLRGSASSLYGHCLRALARAEARGVHGLPLIGCGD
jgi:cellobiose phosphorylase